jgi:primosomal protein N' (replication factor Y)
VGVIGADGALFSADFRASERLFSQLVQVSGRAGRAQQPGEVLIQTDFPEHPLFAAVALQDYDRFADATLEERRFAGFPPFAHLALLRAESKRTGEAQSFLRLGARAGRRIAGQVTRAGIDVFDPVAASLERKAGFERAQLMVRSRKRGAMQAFLAEWKEALDSLAARHVRWAIDVDPQEV